MARDAWNAKIQIGSRTTRDVDIAVYIITQKQYDEVIERLTNSYEFSEIKNLPFKLQNPFGYMIISLLLGG